MEHFCVSLVPIFNQLALTDQETINQLVRHQAFKKGEQIITPDNEPRLVIVVHGSLKVYQLSVSGREQLLRVAEPGDYEGENLLFGAQNENLFAEALQDTEVCLLREQDFRALLLKHPELSLAVLKISAEKMNKVERQSRFLLMEKVEERLATYLLDLEKSTGTERVTIPMKMKELAAFLGTTPETLSRKLKLLESERLIERHGKKIVLVDKEQLEDLTL
jgi:CRP/FNR family transcriptional regulator